ncbi:ABC transporter substrate-binding protein [Pseudolactococcus paracarnosus]|uniref:ABC transporter substrate-binding protein n=1 Tax=Pseudolactococcus paracarnosus TaxID=2749962 RepID=A0A7L4WB80_9LACT|nr:ABC transporter substrate-binding protein [Lactococcus paracarnosus]SPC36632.1 Branched-chain amino acid ABC transporter, amino acid-binding protein (TC 3.A.1.4.1) [Lactococcus piscium]MCJ1977264.1 ABC transporter substrate-binding protein [Lactococcus paracarnosus]MCJ1983240.1 ABC transporter substrate-binding protein [Lactococcus paracarnosus]MCJ1993148.1 ABC transporter substrate-binding protein [Lactococcus paracarnosus]MCJ1998869.1 ABC transporter substrate-binding protein [Lactococcus
MKKIAILGLSVLGLVLLVACGSAPGASQSGSDKGNTIGKTVKIGVNMELSGAYAAPGNAEKNAIQLATDEINAKGGIGGKQIELVVKDNKTDNGEVATVVSNLTNNDKVAAIIGPMSSGGTLAATPNVTKAQVPLITPTGTNDSLTYKNDKVQPYIFRTIFPDAFQGKVIANYTEKSLNAKKVLVYYDNSSDYARGILKTFKANYKGTIVDTLSYQAGDKDFQAALTKVKNKSFDAIALIGYYAEGGLITKQAREMGITQPIVGGDGISDPTYTALAGNAATNVHYVAGFSTKAPFNETTKKFIDAYQKAYNEEPSAFAACAYDAVYMIKQAAESGKVENSVALANALGKVKGLVGATGTIDIDKHHNPVKSAVMVKLEDGKEVAAEIVK